MWTWIAVAGSTAVIMTFIGVMLVIKGKPGPKTDDLSTPAKVPAGSAEAPPDPNRPWPGEQAALDTCNAELILKLVDDWNEVDAYAVVVRAASAYQAKCKRLPRLDWKLLYAHEQLEQWKPAQAVADRLLREQPGDMDFWWWRGKTRRYTGEHDRALADLRQSLVEADASSNGVQIDHLAASAAALGRPCETAFSLRWLRNAGVELRRAAERQYREAYLAGGCETLDGQGTLTWSADAMKPTKLAGKLGPKAIKVLIDPSLGTTLVRRAVAEELGLAQGAALDLLTSTGLGTGTASTVSLAVGKASAAEVPVAIVDELPAGVDAVVGLSFLWRFRVERTEAGYQAHPPAADEPAADE